MVAGDVADAPQGLMLVSDVGVGRRNEADEDGDGAVVDDDPHVVRVVSRSREEWW